MKPKSQNPKNFEKAIGQRYPLPAGPLVFRSEKMEKITLEELVRRLALLAFSRGKKGQTFCTHDESIHPVYNPAYELGNEYWKGRVKEPHTLVGCGCTRCRLDRIIEEALKD